MLKVGANIQLLERDRSGKEPKHSYAYRMSPYGNLKDENGKYVRYPMYPEVLYYSPFTDQDAIEDDKSRAVYKSGFLEVKLPLKGFSYRANAGYSYRHREIGKYFGSTTRTGEPVSGKAEIEDYSYGDWTWENIARYDNTWDKHHPDVTALYSAQETYSTEHKSTGEGFLSDNNSYHNIGIAQGKKTIASSRKETSMMSAMGRINYSFDKRYLLTFTGRRDGYSAFGEGNNKWAFFPSVARAWVVSEESFWNQSLKDKVEFLKLRLSYGSCGNLAIDPYATKTKLIQKDYIFGNSTEFAGRLAMNFDGGNPNLKWETTKTFNAGIDFNFYDNRLSGSFDYYIANTSDLLMKRAVPVMNGYTTVLDNVEKTKNTGFDLTLTSQNIVTNDFQWSSTFVLSGNCSEIKKLRGDGKDDIASKWFIEHPIGVYYD